MSEKIDALEFLRGKNTVSPDIDSVKGEFTRKMDEGATNLGLKGGMDTVKKALPSKEDLPELGMAAVAGGVAASGGLGAIPAMVLTALASAGGEGYKQILQRFGVLEGTPPETVGGQTKEMLVAGARGAISEGAGQAVKGAGNLMKGYAGELGEAFVGTPKKSVEKSLSKGTQTLGERYAGGEGALGSRRAVQNEAETAIDQIEKQIQDKLNSSPTAPYAVNTFEVASKLDPVIDQYKRTGHTAEASRLLKVKEAFMKQYQSGLSVEEANALKRDLYKLAGERAYLSERTAIKTEADKILANGLKEAIEKSVPSIKNLNAKQGFFIQLRDSLVGERAREQGSIGFTTPVKPLAESILSRSARGASVTADFLKKFKNQRAAQALSQLGLQKLEENP